MSIQPPFPTQIAFRHALTMTFMSRRRFQACSTAFLILAVFVLSADPDAGGVTRSTTGALPGKLHMGRTTIWDFLQAPAVGVKHSAVVLPSDEGCAFLLFGEGSDRQINRTTRLGLTQVRIVADNLIVFCETFISKPSESVGRPGPNRASYFYSTSQHEINNL